MVRRLTAAAAIWLVGAFLAPRADAAKVNAGWVIPETLIVRSGPGSDRRQIGTVSRGQKIHVTAFADGWCWGKLPNGQWGWMAEKYLNFSANAGQALAQAAGRSSSSSSSDSSDRGSPAWVKVGGANVRAGPGTSYPSYGTRPRGTKVYVLGRRGNWAKVKTPGGCGWVLADLLTDSVATGQRLAGTPTATAPVKQPTLKGFVDGEKVYLRSGPSVRFDARAVLEKGQTLYLFQKSGEWVKARVHGGAVGWVYGDYVKLPGGAPTGSGPGSAPSPPVADFPSPTRQYTGGSRLSELEAWVDEGNSRVRYGPGVESDVKAVLDRGTKVTVTDISGHWCKVRLPSGSYGWMAGWVLDFDGPGDDITAQESGQQVEVKVGWVARPQVNLRSGPGMEYDAVGEAALSTQVVILDQKSQWYKVGLDGGREAWAASWLIDTREERQVRTARRGSVLGQPTTTGPCAPLLRGASDLGERIVQVAMSRVGDPYHRGSASSEAVDCSGLVKWVHQQMGIDLSRSSRDQYLQGTPVSRSELAPGDCVFFSNTYRRGISHVGIYVGDGRFVHASNPHGGVKVSSLDDDYYGPKYAGARRMR